MLLFESKRIMTEVENGVFNLGYSDVFNINNKKEFQLLWQKGMEIVYYK